MTRYAVVLSLLGALALSGCARKQVVAPVVPAAPAPVMRTIEK